VVLVCEAREEDDLLLLRMPLSGASLLWLLLLVCGREICKIGWCKLCTLL
jgi:hypothetical protein